MTDAVDVIWIEAAEDALHESGGSHILASEKHVDWLARHIQVMASLDPAKCRTYPGQFAGVGLYGDAMAAAMREWMRDTDKRDGAAR